MDLLGGRIFSAEGIEGFNFRFGKLEQFGGNYVNAGMVKAFVSSDEYNRRFGS